jgi:hypothetical protein
MMSASAARRDRRIKLWRGGAMATRYSAAT